MLARNWSRRPSVCSLARCVCARAHLNRNQSRIKGAPVLRDGQFWKYPVCKLMPTSSRGEDQWASPWAEDGPIREIFAKDILHTLIWDENGLLIQDRYLIPVMDEIRKVEEAGKRRMRQGNIKKKPPLTVIDDEDKVQHSSAAASKDKKRTRDEEEKPTRQKGKSDKTRPERKRQKHVVLSEDPEDEEKWNDLQEAAVDRLKIAHHDLHVKQAVYVVDRDTKTRTEKILEAVVVRKSASSSAKRQPHLQNWDLQFRNEKHTYAYPAWAIFKNKKIAECVFEEMLSSKD